VGVRVRVDGVGRAVRGPARVRDPRVPGGKARSEGFLEHADLPRGLVDIDAAVLDQREPHGVVPAVLEAPQSLEQERRRLPRPRVAYDAAHGRTPVSASRTGGRIHLQSRCCAAARKGRRLWWDSPGASLMLPTWIRPLGLAEHVIVGDASSPSLPLLGRPAWPGYLPRPPWAVALGRAVGGCDKPRALPAHR